MARPHDPEKRRDLARRGADVLASHGLGLPAARLAAELGVKRPTLLYHFPTYSHLLEAALIELFSEQLVQVGAAVAAQSHPIDKLFAHLQAVHAFHAGHEARIVFLTQALAATAGERARQILALADALGAAHRKSMIEALEQGMEAGTVAPCDPAALLSVVRALVDGLLVQRVVQSGSLEAAHQLIWRNLLAPLKRSLPPRRRGARPASHATSRRGRA